MLLFFILISINIDKIQEDKSHNKLYTTNLEKKIIESFSMICGKGLVYVESLANHHRHHHGIKSENCGFDKKPFECRRCSIRLSLSNNLARHAKAFK